MAISLFGYAKTTQALAALFARKFEKCHIYDDAFTEQSEDKWGNVLLNVAAFDENKSTLEIPSPGFPPYHKLIQKAKNLQSEYDFFYDASPKAVWISGTNGKTTTTQMIQELFKPFGSQMGGNIGVPLAQLNCNARFWILETSSFSLHYTKRARPELYILLPISKDHLSWHGSFKAYEEAKLSVLKRMKATDLALIPHSYACVKSEARIITYKDEVDLASKFGINLDKIAFQSPFLLDALLALSAEKIVFDSLSYELLNDFTIKEHKLEELKDFQERIWVNDTKATNPDACKMALQRYKNKKIHLILGGDDKGVDLGELFEFMQHLNIKLYLIGASTKKMMYYAKNYQLEAENCEKLEKAVLSINAVLKADEIALLSPACASLDQFSSYAQRGRVFKTCVKKLSLL